MVDIERRWRGNWRFDVGTFIIDAFHNIVIEWTRNAVTLALLQGDTDVVVVLGKLGTRLIRAFLLNYLASCQCTL